MEMENPVHKHPRYKKVAAQTGIGSNKAERNVHEDGLEYSEDSESSPSRRQFKVEVALQRMLEKLKMMQLNRAYSSKKKQNISNHRILSRIV